MQARQLLKARRLAKGGPPAEQLATLGLDGGVREIAGAADAQALQQRLVEKVALEPVAGVLNEAVEDDEGAQLAVHVTVLELLAEGAGRLRGPCRLQADDLDEVRDAAEVVLLVGLGCEVLDGDGDRREGFLLGKGRRNVLVQGREELGGASYRVTRHAP